MLDLEQRLLDLGRDLDYPRAPNLAVMVRRRIEAPTPRRSFWPRPLLVAAAIALVVLAALVAFPPTRTAIAGFFGIRGVTIQRVPTLPSPTPAAAQSIGDRLQLGRQVTLEQAQSAVGYHVLVPQALGRPDQVYLMDPADRQGIAFVYLPRPDLPPAAQTGVGLLLIEFPGQVQKDYLLKMLGSDATTQDVTVNGNAGIWISGAPHGLLYVDPKGNIQQDTFRLAGNTLLWNQGTLTLRIEAGLTRDQALAIAASLR